MSKTTDEAQARIEHKVDVILDLVMEFVGRLHGIHPNAIPKMGSLSHQCPICKKTVKYLVDIQDRSVTRQCDCKTGLTAPLDLEQFAPPPAAGGKHGYQRRRDDDSTGDGDTGPGSSEQPKATRNR